MHATFVLVAEHAISRLRGTAGWEEIAAGAGVDLPVDLGTSYPATTMADLADRLAAALSTDRPTALRAIGEHGFPWVVDAVPSVFETEEELSPARHADEIFRQLSDLLHALLTDLPASEVPQIAWTREGRRRELTARTDADIADLIEGQVIGLLEWLDLDAKLERNDLGNSLYRFELWYD